MTIRVSGVLPTCPWDCNHPLHVHEDIFFLESYVYVLFLFGVSGAFLEGKKYLLWIAFTSTYLKNCLFSPLTIWDSQHLHEALAESSSKPFLVGKGLFALRGLFLRLLMRIHQMGVSLNGDSPKTLQNDHFQYENQWTNGCWVPPV